MTGNKREKVEERKIIGGRNTVFLSPEVLRASGLRTGDEVMVSAEMGKIVLIPTILGIARSDE